MESQLTILSESLDKKLEVLQKIQEYNKRQEEVFSAEKVDMSLFDDAVEEKQRLIDEVVRLDDGFEIMYEKLARELEGNRQRYAAQIRELQAKVAKVTELSVSAQAQEARKDGTQVLVARMNKNKKFQKEQLNKEGYEEFVEFYKEELKR